MYISLSMHCWEHFSVEFVHRGRNIFSLKTNLIWHSTQNQDIFKNEEELVHCKNSK